MSNSNNENNIIIGNIEDYNTISITTDTVTLDLSNCGAAQSVYTISGDTINVSGISTIDSLNIGDISTTSFNWSFTTTPFEDGFPEWSDFRDMCKEYPGLQITFEKMKEFYNLCKSDWEGKKRGEE